MNSLQKFQDLLKRLFHFEASDLDFVIYCLHSSTEKDF